MPFLMRERNIWITEDARVLVNSITHMPSNAISLPQQCICSEIRLCKLFCAALYTTA